MRDQEYFRLWHLSQQLRDKYDPNYSPKVTIVYPPGGLVFSPPPCTVVDHNDKRPAIEFVIGEFLEEFNRRHDIFISVDEYLR